MAVRFSPIRYQLRDLPRPTNVVKGGSEIGAREEEEEEKQLWENTQTLFCLPYRMVYAVATVNSVTIYDTQQVRQCGEGRVGRSFKTEIANHQPEKSPAWAKQYTIRPGSTLATNLNN